MEFVFCTHNTHKIQEVAAIAGHTFEWLNLTDIGFTEDIPEPFQTLQENALQKAITVHAFCGKNCFAEDTGLFVPAINGEPGVYSARYAGEPANSANNIHKLLNRLVGENDRRAYFKTVIAAIINKQKYFFEGECHGRIAHNLSGNEGFGYDPVFIPENFDCTFAMMEPHIKNKISHRKKAFDAFVTFLHQTQ